MREREREREIETACVVGEEEFIGRKLLLFISVDTLSCCSYHDIVLSLISL